MSEVEYGEDSKRVNWAQSDVVARLGVAPTLLMNLWNGSPLSLANDQVIRDAVARNPITAHHTSPTTRADMAVVPAYD